MSRLKKVQKSTRSVKWELAPDIKKRSFELIGQFDLVIASGMLYQLTPEEEKKFLQQIGQVAKPDAWFIATDYPREVSYKQPFSYTTWAQHISDGKFSKQLEFIKADDPFTTVIKPGKDFTTVKDIKG